MTNRPENRRTINGADLSYMSDDVHRGDLDRGYFDAAPNTTYGDRAPSSGRSADDGMTIFPGDDQGPTRHSDMIEDDGFHRTHGSMEQYGFVRRPGYKTDIERN